MAIQIIGFPMSTCTLRVLATLKELGVPYEVTPPSEFSELKTPEYLANKHPL
jgi:glutathione S-transferase